MSESAKKSHEKQVEKASEHQITRFAQLQMPSNQRNGLASLVTRSPPPREPPKSEKDPTEQQADRSNRQHVGRAIAEPERPFINQHASRPNLLMVKIANAIAYRQLIPCSIFLITVACAYDPRQGWRGEGCMFCFGATSRSGFALPRG